MNSVYSYLCCAEETVNDFVVGLTNVSPLDSEPILGNYTLCGQYPGKVALGATVILQCDDNLQLFRYVIVHFPSTDIFIVCEIQVMIRGMPEMLAVQSILGFVAQTPLVRFCCRLAVIMLSN